MPTPNSEGQIRAGASRRCHDDVACASRPTRDLNADLLPVSSRVCTPVDILCYWSPIDCDCRASLASTKVQPIDIEIDSVATFTSCRWSGLHVLVHADRCRGKCWQREEEHENKDKERLHANGRVRGEVRSGNRLGHDARVDGDRLRKNCADMWSSQWLYGWDATP